MSRNTNPYEQSSEPLEEEDDILVEEDGDPCEDTTLQREVDRHRDMPYGC